MINPQPNVVTAAWQVRQELKVLGLTPEIVQKIARACAAGKAEAMGVDPLSTPGTLGYIQGVRTKRLELLPLGGWRMSRNGNVEATVNDAAGIQLYFQNVDLACTDRIPQAISGKGSGSRRLILDGHQGELFAKEGQASKTVDKLGVTPRVWAICVSTDAKKLRAEVSCPEAFEGDQFEGFSKRIFVVDEDLNPTPDRIDQPDGGGEGDFEVRISKKQ